MTPFDVLHILAAMVITIIGVFRMNAMTRATPILDVLGWWSLTVGAFAHGVVRPKYDVEWADALLICGGALIVVLETWPQMRALCVANRRDRRRDDEVVS